MCVCDSRVSTSTRLSWTAAVAASAADAGVVKKTEGRKVVFSYITLFSLMFPGRPASEQGGLLGQWVGTLLLNNLHPVGSYLLLIVLLALSILAIGETTLLGHMKAFLFSSTRFFRNLALALWRYAGILGRALYRGLARLAAFLRRWR